MRGMYNTMLLAGLVVSMVVFTARGDDQLPKADVAKLGPKSIHGSEITGLRSRKGHISFCGHGHRVEFRNIRIKELK